MFSVATVTTRHGFESWFVFRAPLHMTISVVQKLDQSGIKLSKNAFQVDTYYAQSDPTTPSFTYSDSNRRFSDYFTGYSGREDPAQKNVTLMRASQYNKLRVAASLFGTDGYMVWTLNANLTKYWQDSLAIIPLATKKLPLLI